MNPSLDDLQPYAFQRLHALLKGVDAIAALEPIKLHIGEPKHPTPQFIRDALTGALDGLAIYPSTLGESSLRRTIAAWMDKRYGLPGIDPSSQIIPVNGSREALFGLAQAAVAALVVEDFEAAA